MARTHTFVGSAEPGCGYAAFIEEGKLLITEDWGNWGGILYHGDYSHAANFLIRLKKEAPTLYNSIVEYYKNEMLKAHGFDEETKTILFKVKIYNKNGAVHNCLVRGRTQSGIIFRLMKGDPEVHTLQTSSANVFAIRSDEISAVEFVESFSPAATITKAVGIK